MDVRLQKQILARRIEMLKGHLWVRAQPEHEAPSPLCESELEKAESELQALEQRK
jgi:hypothetical protein